MIEEKSTRNDFLFQISSLSESESESAAKGEILLENERENFHSARKERDLSEILSKFEAVARRFKRFLMEFLSQIPDK